MSEVYRELVKMAKQAQQKRDHYKSLPGGRDKADAFQRVHDSVRAIIDECRAAGV